MKRKFQRLIKNRRIMAAIAAFLFASDIVITMMASNVDWLNAHAATTGSLASMRARAEAIVNYQWTPSWNIMTWNGSTYNGLTYFPAGVPVKGVPFSLFTSEVVGRSQLTLSEYGSYASSNYSTTAKCKSKSNEVRTGPVYGSCCAAFVSEVMGGSWMGINVSSIATSRQASHVTDAYEKNVRVGDALDKGSHIIWIGDITDEYYVVYEQTPPVARKVLLKKSEARDAYGRFRYNYSSYNRISRFNLKDTNLSVSAPGAYATAAYYAENATATVQWGAVANASYYIIDAYKDGQCIVSGETVLDNYYNINKGNGNYTVYITAVCGYNKSTSGPVSFTVGHLDTPEITSTTEIYESGEEVSIQWNACTGATGYNISIIKDNKSTCVNTSLTTNSYTFSPEDGYYEARVEAKNENGGFQKTVSNIYSFFVGNKRLIAFDKSVTHFAHNGTANLSWTDCEGVSDYSLVITDTKDDTEVFNNTVSESNSYAVPDLPDGHYKAIVSAAESKGEYDWLPSKSFSFYVGKLDKPVVVPDAKYHALNSKTTVTWKQCEGAVRYRVEVRSQGNKVFEDELTGTTCTFDVESGKYSVTVAAINTNGGYQECKSKTIEVWAVSLTIDGSVQTMHPGDSASLTAAVSEHDPKDTLQWSSSASNIVSVASDGTITAQGAGTTNVNAHIGDLFVSYTVCVVPNLSFETLGASIRLSQPYGIRFGIRIGKNQDYHAVQIVEYGTLIIGAGTLGNNDLTLDTNSILKIRADKYLENTSTHILYTGVLINIPKTFFGTDVVGRGYLKYRGLDGVVYTVYSEKVVKSFNGVLQSAYDSYTSIEEPNASQLEIIHKLKALIDEGKPNEEEQPENTSSNEEQPDTTSSNETQRENASSNTEQTETTSSNEEQPEATSSTGEQPPAASSDEEQSETTPSNEEPPEASSSTGE